MQKAPSQFPLRQGSNFETDGVPKLSSLKHFPAGKTKPQLLSQLGFRNLILTMTYSHMGKPHTTIGDASFH
ncbi:hypothetical protein, partial [Pseudomonas fluorescens]|uniref:hypothetical protein n=1 Tax=Pseudomonas fluorescens TaxID=294 RepID=UPI001CD57B9B